MGSGKRTCWTQLWLLSSLAFIFLTSSADSSPLKVMSAPSVLRLGRPENIFVECQDCPGDNEFMVEIIIWSYPTKSKRVASTSVSLNMTNKFQTFGQIKIPDEGFSKDPTVEQCVYLQARFPDVELEKVVLVSFQFGYIFIQTDKTLYIPNSKVLPSFEVKLKPIEEGEGAVTLKKEHITQIFPNILGLVGSSIFVAVSVLTDSEQIEVMNPDGTPVQGVKVVVDVDEVGGITAANGMARLSINTHKKSEPLTITILSRGHLMKYGRFRIKGQVLISITNTVTKDMLPSFRIIAYYHSNDNEVVSDSVWVDVRDSCMGSLKLESTSTATSYEPRKLFGLKVTGDPEATVGLVAVDKGVYVLNNKHRLTQKKVWDTVENYDTGCTPGGGKDSMSVFYDAGLLFESSTGFGTPYRKGLNCHTASRKKRATSFMNITTSLVSQYDDELQRDCCFDGMRDTPVSYTCERRSEYILDGAACIQAFLHCCKVIESKRAEKRKENLHLARSEEDDNSFMDSNEIISRTKFPESWLWTDIKLPACSNPNCVTTSAVKNVPLQDSITTWQFTGISLSRTHGICVADPLEVIVRKDFFIDLRLPYSAVRGEQLEIKAVLHNYLSDPATVRVDLIEEEHICSAASKRGKYYQEVKVGNQATRSVPFVIIPIREGLFRIEVKATVKDSSFSDGITKMLLVVPEGLLIKSPQTITLDPANKGVDGKQVAVINSGIPKKYLHPNTPTSTQISLTGREYLHELKNEISGKPMGDLIYQPTGCGEENMIHMTLPVIATTYLDKTNQWEPAHIQRRSDALRYMSIGYQNQLHYRKKDGSFALSSDHQSSTWLTAYVVKVFTMAYNLVAVQSEVICDAVKFLILNAQQPNGEFRELGRVSHTAMIGDVHGTDSDASMAAFCLIAMQESRTICATTVDSLQESINRTASYLEKRLPSLINPYAIAMASYALAGENKLNEEIVYKFASPDLSHWPVPKGRVGTLEATAYTLLALVKAKANMMVYQAVAEYWASAKEQEYDLNVDLLLPGRSKPSKYNFNNKTPYATRTSKNLYSVSDINYSVHFLGRYKDEEYDATMSILDIGMLTGFTINTKDLDLVSHTRPEEITFRIHQKLKVGVLQPAAVSVYEYDNQYRTQSQCVKFYHPERRAGELLRLCRNDVCICAEENCSLQKQGKIDNHERTAKACETKMNSRIDFVYKVHLEEFTDGLSTDIYTVRVLEVIKEGSYDVGPLGKLRTFLSYPHCRVALGLGTGKSYLIMGRSKDIYTDDQSQMHRYVLGERTWIEYWPTETECNTGTHNSTCSGIEEMIQTYTLHGCQQ
ncbi:Complement C3 Complement C3 beta chain Complement C3 alpha chain [Channa argus]|uniref:Complement C3 Complement C3 beta chain Complement C3 alpha chain n=1 Tax=Channa argus TaxID=215402 RepID=A0A6G1PAV1_CHAAH|nr:Complement C3 Complement C3 beta chain Complement C3 alpha chain [Channa argus]